MPTNYLTPQGFKKLKDELMQLLDVERPQVVHAVGVAAAMGDRSENAEYIYGKRRLREIDRRIRFLQKRLEKVEIIKPENVDTSRVSFGVLVKVEDEEGVLAQYQIVGEDEIDPKSGRITFSSPIGKALLGKKVDDVVSIIRPKGDMELRIISISRPPT